MGIREVVQISVGATLADRRDRFAHHTHWTLKKRSDTSSLYVMVEKKYFIRFMLGLFYKSNSPEAKLSCCVLIVKITLNVSVPYIFFIYIYIYTYI